MQQKVAKKVYTFFGKKTWRGGAGKRTSQKYTTIFHITSFHIPHSPQQKKLLKKSTLFTLSSCFPHLPRKKGDKKPTKKRQKRRYFYRLLRYIIYHLSRLRRCYCYCYRMIITTTVIILSIIHRPYPPPYLL